MPLQWKCQQSGVFALGKCICGRLIRQCAPLRVMFEWCQGSGKIIHVCTSSTHANADACRRPRKTVEYVQGRGTAETFMARTGRFQTEGNEHTVELAKMRGAMDEGFSSRANRTRERAGQTHIFIKISDMLRIFILWLMNGKTWTACWNGQKRRAPWTCQQRQDGPTGQRSLEREVASLQHMGI